MTSQIDNTVPVFGAPTTQSVRDQFTTAANEITALQNATQGSPFLSLQGGRMNGPMYLYNDPTDAMMPATKGYVDAGGAGGAGGIPEAPSIAGEIFGRSQGAWVLVLGLNGGTLTGPVIAAADPTVPLGMATKQYVDAVAATIVADAPNDAFAYARHQDAWTKVLMLTGGVLSGTLGVGVTPPSDASTTTLGVFTQELVTAGGGHLFNAYVDTGGIYRYLTAAGAAALRLSGTALTLASANTGAVDAAITWGSPVTVDYLGNLVLSGSTAIPTDAAYPIISAKGYATTGSYNFNAYAATGSQWKYLTAGYAGLIQLDGSGNFTFWGTPGSGAAGGLVSFSEIAYLSPSGNLTVIGGFAASGNITTSANLSVSGTTTSTGRILTTSGRIISQTGNNPSFISYDTSSSTAQGMWSNNGQVFLGSSDGNGNPTANWLNLTAASCGITGNLVALGNVITTQSNGTPRFCAYSLNGGVNMGFYVDTTQRMMISNFDGSNNLSSVSMYIQGGSITITNATAGKPGGGAWADSSDPRIKKIHGNYDIGLDAILQLRPIEYSFLGNEMTHPPTEDRPYEQSPHAIVAEAGTRFVGLDASDVESVMPEMVTKRTAYIDGAEIDDLRYLDTGPLIYAVVNAFKEVNARLAALEGARK